MLVVEDDKITNEIVSHMLKSYFKSVISCHSAEDAYTHYLNIKPDVIITDINLPGMNGVELSRKIRKDDTSTPIAIITSHTKNNYLVDLLNMQILFYLLKPIEKVNFNEMMKKIIDTFNGNEKDFYFEKNIYYDYKKKIIVNTSNYISLNNKEIEFIEEFIQNKNSILPSEHFEIKFDIENSNAVKLHISRLRKKLPKDTIKTIYSRGYMLDTSNTYKI
ncbi:response regulator transcription factor [Sulfurimonas sp.]|uniref:response regulator transcription factor n=1 Tax=Sulfurimonas sp. TaxID=2022749 RepID=UPI003561BCB5